MHPPVDKKFKPMTREKCFSFIVSSGGLFVTAVDQNDLLWLIKTSTGRYLFIHGLVEYTCTGG